MVSLNVSVRLCKFELFIAWILASGEEKYTINLSFFFYGVEKDLLYGIYNKLVVLRVLYFGINVYQ